MSAEDILKALPSLETQRLILRKFSTKDARDLYEYASDIEIADLGMWYPFNSFEESKQYISRILEAYEKGEIVTWAIEFKADLKMIGSISFAGYSFQNARAEIGYAMNRDYWCQGLMSEAVEDAIAFGFTGNNGSKALSFQDGFIYVMIFCVESSHVNDCFRIQS